MIHADPASTAQPDQIAQAYDQVAAGYDQHYCTPAARAEDRLLVRRIRRLLLSEPVRCNGCGRRLLTDERYGLVLDLGCGTGWLLDQLPLQPWQYRGVDISPGMLAQARAKYPHHRFALADMAEPIVKPGTASLVVSTFGALNYHPDPLRVLRLAYQALRPDGRLLLVVYAPGHPPTGAVFQGDGPRSLPIHPDTLRWMVTDAGFTVIRIRGLRQPRNPLPDRTPAWTHRAWLALETATAGRFAPASAVFLLLEARC